MLSSDPLGQTSTSSSIFNGAVTFQNNQFITTGFDQSVGAGLANFYFTQTIFNQQVRFINNQAISQALVAGGAIAHAFNSTLIFNQSSLFMGNRAVSANGPAFGGAFATAVSSPAAYFNAPAIFINNSITNNSPLPVDNGSNAYGGAITAASTASITLVNPQFMGNQAIAPNTFAYGGAIALMNGTVTIRSTDPTTPVLFQGNTATDSRGTRQEAFYLSGGLGIGAPFIPGPSTLILDADASTSISILDGISSDGKGNQILKRGLGTWEQGGIRAGIKI